MIEEQMIVTAERLRDDVVNFKAALRAKYGPTSQVTSDDLRRKAAGLAEKWLVELAIDDAVKAALGDSTLADLNVHFQRVLTFSEHATVRKRYDAEINNILRGYLQRSAVDVLRMASQIGQWIDSVLNLVQTWEQSRERQKYEIR
jgi:hypothetical protein